MTAIEPHVAPVGRLTVADGQTILATWGNTTYDQTAQTYASATDRASQWPAPNEGALSFLVDTHTPWIFRNGAWHGLPVGWLASATGPAAQTDCATAWTTVATVSVPVVVGRRYLIIGTGTGQQQTAAALSQIRIADDQGATTAIGMQNALAVGAYMAGSGTVLYTPTSTKTAALNVQGQASAGALRFAANIVSIVVSDIGG